MPKIGTNTSNYIPSKKWEVEIQYVNSSDHIYTIFKYYHTSVISQDVGNLLIFRDKVLDIRLKVYLFEM